MSSPNLDQSAQQLSAGHINAATCALNREMMVELGDMLGSLGVSIAEAAWRGSPGLCRLHLIESRAVLKTAIEILKSWEASSKAEDSAA